MAYIGGPIMKHLPTALIPALLLPAVAPAQSVFDLDEIVFSVNANEALQDQIGNSVSVLTEEDLEQAGDLQLTEVLSRLPGVSLSQNGPQGGTADVRIRGAQGRYISVYVDGILVTDPSGTVIAYEDFGGLTTGSIRRIEVLRGSQSALYGGSAVGGVINITTIAGEDAPEGTSQTATVEAGSYNTYALSYGLTQRTGPLTLSLGLDHTRSDGFSAAEENVGNTEADGFDRSRLSFGAAYKVTDALTVGFNGFIERGSHEFDGFTPAFIPDDDTLDQEAERDTLGLRAFVAYQSGIWAHDAAISLYDIERRSFSGGDLSIFNGRRLAFDYTSSAELSEALQLAFGLNAQREEAEYGNIPGGSAKVDTYGAFAEAIWSPSDSFDLTGTLRYDDHSTFGGQTTGRLAFAWRPDGNTIVRGAFGTGYRPPSIDELFGDYPGFFFTGNPDLVPEESLSAEIGIERSFSNGATVSATAFVLEIENLVTFCSAFSLPSSGCPIIAPGDPDTLANVPGTSTRRGLELSGWFPISDSLSLTGAYTYTDAQTATGAPLALVPEHDIALGIDANWGNGWSGDLTAQRVVGVIETDGNPLPDYTLVNASIGYEVAEGVEAYLRIHNLFDEQYQTRRGYGTSDRAFYLGLRSRF
jgi:vitamin B12 transporter